MFGWAYPNFVEIPLRNMNFYEFTDQCIGNWIFLTLQGVRNIWTLSLCSSEAQSYTCVRSYKFLSAIPAYLWICSKLLIFLILKWLLVSLKLYSTRNKIQWRFPSNFASHTPKRKFLSFRSLIISVEFFTQNMEFF